ncbi:TPA: H-NS histone family protein [Escherichia coli]|uniref:H-NS family nucleoid-associated regulatory protein n=1 Tax=Enterobacter hormaechei TaxID=158836 RepID=UPI001BCB31BF|nr:H-NS family nucleoid-associated regulatory protein [Enterobacter hormaechei]HBK9494366.1 H-NS histone family protein [Escherichia coli]
MSALGQFNNIRTIRKEAHEMGYDTFLEFAEKVQTVKDEFLKEAEEEKAKQALVEEKLKATTELLQSEGFEVSLEAVRALLLGQIDTPAPTGKGKGGKGVKRGSVEPKYAFTVEGEEQTWTGRGRMPLALKALIEKGEELESFLIKKED